MGYDQPIEAKASIAANPTTTFILGSRVLAQADSSGTVTYLLVDGHGSTQALTSSTGAVNATFRYDAFGTALNFSPNSAPSATSTPLMFGGDAIYDSTSGLYFHGNGVRPTNGFLFIQRDTYSGNTQDPLSLHKYLYAGANPVSGTDPTGHFVDLLISAAINAGRYASTLGADAVAFGQAAAVVSAITYVSASYGVALAQSTGDTAAAAFYSEVQSISLTTLEVSAGFIGAGLALSVLGSALTFGGTAIAALSTTRNVLTASTNAEAAAIIRTLPPGQVSALQRWLGNGMAGRLAAGLAPSNLDSATLLAYRQVLQANMDRGVQDNGVMQASIDAINASLKARGV